MDIRRLLPADLDAYFACRLRALEQAPAAFVTSLEEERARGPARFAVTLADSGDEKVLFGAVDAGVVVGTVGLLRGDRVKTRHKASVVGMYVDQDRQRQGIGGRLLDLALGHARETMQVTAVSLSLEATNDTARRLYESRGFVAWGTEPRAMYAGGRFHDELHMTLSLGPALSFRPLTHADLPQLQRWLAEPHVEAWWHQALDLDAVRAKYGPRIDGREPTHVLVLVCDDRPVGWIQWYRWRDYPDHARQLGAEPSTVGLDLAIGEPGMTGLGLGTRVLRQFVRDVLFVDPAVSACIADPEEANVASLRAFEKAGFRATATVTLAGETAPRRLMRLARL